MKPQYICNPPVCWLPANCGSCGKPVEKPRRCYAHPTCFACLPPPPPLEVIVLTSLQVPPSPGRQAYVYHLTTLSLCLDVWLAVLTMSAGSLLSWATFLCVALMSVHWLFAAAALGFLVFDATLLVLR